MTELRQKINNIVEEKNTKVVPENIRAGRTMFDVEGTFSSDANATASDILKDKTAYVNGEKIEGTYEPLDTSDANATASDIMKDKTAYVNGVKVVGTHEDASGESEYNAIIKDNGNQTFVFGKSSLIKINSFYISGNNLSSAFSSSINLEEVINLNIPNCTDIRYAFENCSKLKKVTLKNTNNITNFNYTFSNCNLLSEISGIFSSLKINYIRGTFQNCKSLTTIPKFECGKVIGVTNPFEGCINLRNMGGLKNLGKGYTSKTTNDSNYKLDLSSCTNLTHDSLINVINNLYDLNLTYNVANGGTLYTQQLILGSTNLAKLTAEEIAIATNKGWTVS